MAISIPIDSRRTRCKVVIKFELSFHRQINHFRRISTSFLTSWRNSLIISQILINHSFPVNLSSPVKLNSFFGVEIGNVIFYKIILTFSIIKLIGRDTFVRYKILIGKFKIRDCSCEFRKCIFYIISSIYLFI